MGNVASVTSCAVCTGACDDDFAQKYNVDSPRVLPTPVPAVYPMDLAGHEDILHLSTLERAPLEEYPPRRPVGDMPAAFPRLGSGMATKDMEKARFVQILKDFAARAFLGVNVWTIDPQTGDLFPAKYTLTPDMSHLLVSISGAPDACYDIDKIVGVTWGFEAWPGLPAAFAAQLESDMIKRLVVLKLADESIYFIENTYEKAETTVTALCVLCSYHMHRAVGKGSIEGQLYAA